MSALMLSRSSLLHCFRTLRGVLLGIGRFLVLMVRSHTSVTAENLFLRKQLALFQERKLKPHRTADSTRCLMAALSRLFNWRDALVAVKPDTLIRWHHKGFRLFWR